MTDEAERLGDYLLDDVVASDAVTVTRRARRAGSARPLLLRTLKPGVEPKPELLRALDGERDLLARLDHPTLATLVDAFVHEGAPVLVLLDHGGHALAELLRRSRTVAWQSAVAMTLELARGLAAVHRVGATHGAIDATVVELGAGGTVHLDGLGRLAALGELAPPAGMAPEQILGDLPDVASDVFQLGMLLFRMVAGRDAFETGDDASVAQQIRHAAAPPLTRVAPHAPAALERVVSRCLSKRPRDRYPDMISLCDALAQVLRDDTAWPTELLVGRALARAGLGSEPVLPADRAARRDDASRRRLAAGIFGAGALVLTAVVVGVARFGDPRTPLGPGGPQGIAEQPAEIRVLARPWAEIHIDGRPVETTPISRPIEVAPGRHTVVLKHPNAPDESRTLELIAGQKVLVDVDMKVTRPSADAGAPALAPSDESP